MVTLGPMAEATLASYTLSWCEWPTSDQTFRNKFNNIEHISVGWFLE